MHDIQVQVRVLQLLDGQVLYKFHSVRLVEDVKVFLALLCGNS